MGEKTQNGADCKKQEDGKMETERHKKISKKKRMVIESLQAEYENDKKVLAGDLEMLRMKEEMKKASMEELGIAEKRYNLNKSLISFECNHGRVITPIMEFHTFPEWIKVFKELKEFELENNETQFKIAKKNFEHQQNQIKTIDEEKINEQMNRIKEGLPIKEAKLKDFGIIVGEIKVNQEYIG